MKIVSVSWLLSIATVLWLIIRHRNNRIAVPSVVIYAGKWQSLKLAVVLIGAPIVLFILVFGPLVMMMLGKRRAKFFGSSVMLTSQLPNELTLELIATPSQDPKLPAHSWSPDSEWRPMVRLVRGGSDKVEAWSGANMGKLFPVTWKREGGYDVDLVSIGWPPLTHGFLNDDEVEEIRPIPIPAGRYGELGERRKIRRLADLKLGYLTPDD